MTAAFQSNAFQPNAFQTLIVTGTIYAVDQNDTGTFIGSVTGGQGIDMHDGGIRPHEIKKLKALQKKLAKLQQEKEQAFADANTRRKQAIKDIIEPPVAQVKEVEVESEEAVVSPSIRLTNFDEEIGKIQLQQQLIERQIAQRQAIANYTAYMAILEAKAKAEREDEEALLMLL